MYIYNGGLAKPSPESRALSHVIVISGPFRLCRELSILPETSGSCSIFFHVLFYIILLIMATTEDKNPVDLTAPVPHPMVPPEPKPPDPGEKPRVTSVDDLGQKTNTPLQEPSTSFTLEPYLPTSPKPSVAKSGGKKSSLGHQSVKSGGMFTKDVLYCTKIDSRIEYEHIYEEFRKYGDIRRIKLILDEASITYDLYISFYKSEVAESALKQIKLKDPDSDSTYKLLDSKNLDDGPFDFIPPKIEESKTERKSPKLTWHVGAFKNDSSNFIKASAYIRKKIGNLPQGYIKKYGKGILIRAGNDTQIHMLKNFHPNEEGNIKSVTPHKSFNIVKGVLYSKDLYEFDEEEILEMCPSYVYAVKKLRGFNNAIVLSFSTSSLPSDISIEHSHLKIRKFKQRPKQCFQCYVYGHVVSKCPNEACCRNCSGNHEKTDECSLPPFCFHCSGSHSPSSKKCPKYQLEEKILELAYDEKISFGAARYLIGESDQPYKTILKKPVKPSTQTNGNKQSSPEKAEQSSKPAKKTSEKEKEAETPDVDSPKATKSDGFWKVPSDKKNSSSHGAKEAETTSSQRESSFVTRNRFSALEDESDVESQEDMDDEPISNSESRKRTLETSSPTNKNKKTNINTSRSNLKSINDQSKCQKSNKSPEAM
ncbi:MAG: hypothetical protein AAFY71_28710, partial [Bacteroidota bacterium]